MTEPPILSVHRLSKTVTMHLLGGRKVEAIRDVTFDLHPGRLLGIVGPSGAGKSSLLKCIYRTYIPTSGSILYTTAQRDQVDIATANERRILELRRREIGYVPQFLKAPPRVAAVDFVAASAVARGADREAARAQAIEILDYLGIDRQLQSSYPAVFSGGEQQRVNVARALVDPPRLLLLDEPTSALDAENRQRVVNLLSKARNDGVALIGIFHDDNLMRSLADDVVVLENGRNS